MDKLLIYSDGACSNNGKAAAEICGSFAAYFVPQDSTWSDNPDGHYALKKQKPLVHESRVALNMDDYLLPANVAMPMLVPHTVYDKPKPTNNVAEALTLSKALAWAKCAIHGGTLLCKNIEVCMDSKLVLYQIQGIYSTNNRVLRKIYGGILSTIDKLPPVTFTWIPGDLMKQTIISH